MSDAQARKDVVAAYREIGRRGLIAGSSGNVSHRMRAGMIITPSGCSDETVDVGSLVAMTLAGDVKGNHAPSSEWAMHAAIYLAYPAAQCVVHTHADACTALACLNEGLPAFHYMVANFGGDDVRCAPYVTFGTPELARLAVAALTGRTACLLANHGMIVHASSMQRALSSALVLETLCRQYLLARAAGPVRLLTPDEMRAAHERYRTYGQPASGRQ
ncbi:MAG TPA: class II aldolase/adducin family protein [Acetobacteraceae bacterium]|nr:class II aldolase/adducin family protein [Acetobacteraceae bacterium]